MNKKLEISKLRQGTELLKRGFAKMQKGGVIMDVINAEQAKIAEGSGAVAVMALERVPADIRTAGGVARMADPKVILEIMDTVNIPVMAKVRIGHFVEAQALESIGVDMVDESEVLTPADPFYHIDKRKFTVPFVCGCRNLGEAVRRIWEGAAMIRTKGEAGTGNIIEAIRHQRMVTGTIRSLKDISGDALSKLATEYAQSYVKAIKNFTNQKITDNTLVFEEYSYNEVKKGLLDVLYEIRKIQRLPLVNFAAGGIATPGTPSMRVVKPCGIPPSNNSSNFFIPVLTKACVILLLHYYFIILDSYLTKCFLILSFSFLSLSDALALKTNSHIGNPSLIVLSMTSSPSGKALNNKPLVKP
ncbi:pyridoxal phosphate synthase yaaD subunit [Thermoplasmatales archaeon SCGC AB-539-N05]|nr:pyridoxal phosphate synthase yaaD subunit [Thermoplasmatales archaeon SCGC AB-539-N05]